MFKRSWRSRRNLNFTHHIKLVSKDSGWKSRPTKKTNKRFFLIFILLSLFLTIQSFIYLDKNLRAPIMSLATIRLKQIATDTINSAIIENTKEIDTKKLITWQTNSTTGTDTGFVLDYGEQMKIIENTKNVVENKLKKTDPLLEKIPIGEAFNSIILSSFGPYITIKLVPAGTVKVELMTNSKSSGINMTMVQIFIRVTDEVAIIIPFGSKTETVQTDIPISYVLVKGDVPTYYYDGKGTPQGPVILPNN